PIRNGIPHHTSISSPVDQPQLSTQLGRVRRTPRAFRVHWSASVERPRPQDPSPHPPIGFFPPLDTPLLNPIAHRMSLRRKDTPRKLFSFFPSLGSHARPCAGLPGRERHHSDNVRTLRLLLESVAPHSGVGAVTTDPICPDR